jgi:two-component system invasion response regulator UvrY
MEALPQGGEGGPADRPVVRLLVCDDHRILTETLALAVRSDPAFTLVTPPLSSPQEAIDAVGRLHPDVVLMDIGFSGDMDGIQATRRIKEVSPETA